MTPRVSDCLCECVSGPAIIGVEEDAAEVTKRGLILQ